MFNKHQSFQNQCPLPSPFTLYRVKGGDYMAATIEFQQAVGRVFFDGGLTEDGKLIRKAKTYRYIKEKAPAENLYKALEQLDRLSTLPFIGADIEETSILIN